MYWSFRLALTGLLPGVFDQFPVFGHWAETTELHFTMAATGHLGYCAFTHAQGVRKSGNDKKAKG